MRFGKGKPDLLIRFLAFCCLADDNYLDLGNGFAFVRKEVIHLYNWPSANVTVDS